jgi:alkylation response protein AidB-like acyl-CoA dehydrogenase
MMHTEETPRKIFDGKIYGSRPAGNTRERSTDKWQREVRKLLGNARWKRSIGPDNSGGQGLKWGCQVIAVMVVVVLCTTCNVF